MERDATTSTVRGARAGGDAAGNVSPVTDTSAPNRSRLIVFEGVDAAGKTTQTKLLARNIDAVATFQFGATALGAQLRKLVLDPPEGHVDNRAAALMIAADKAQHLADVVIPALQAGRHVVSDRFTASMLAYQGHGQGLPMGPLEKILEFSVGGLKPDLTVLLDIDPDTAGRRRSERRGPFRTARHAVHPPCPCRISHPRRRRRRPLGCHRRSRHRKHGRCRGRCRGERPARARLNTTRRRCTGSRAGAILAYRDP